LSLSAVIGQSPLTGHCCRLAGDVVISVEQVGLVEPVGPVGKWALPQAAEVRGTDKLQSYWIRKEQL